MPNQPTLVAVATYNEIETLPSLVDAIQAALPYADLLVVDDKSPDGTGEWADGRASADKRVSVVHRAGKLGLGSATFEAMRWAIARDYEVLCTLDADWSHPPERLPDLVAALDQADVAIGSRYSPGGAIRDWPIGRRVMSRVVNVSARRLLRVPVRDLSGAFRAYRVERLKALDFDAMHATGYAYLEEILWRLKHLGATFAEVPITFSERRAGASKINRAEALAAARLLVQLGAQEWLGRPGRRL